MIRKTSEHAKKNGLIVLNNRFDELCSCFLYNFVDSGCIFIAQYYTPLYP